MSKGVSSDTRASVMVRWSMQVMKEHVHRLLSCCACILTRELIYWQIAGIGTLCNTSDKDAQCSSVFTFMWLSAMRQVCHHKDAFNTCCSDGKPATS